MMNVNGYDIRSVVRGLSLTWTVGTPHSERTSFKSRKAAVDWASSQPKYIPRCYCVELAVRYPELRNPPTCSVCHGSK